MERHEFDSSNTRKDREDQAMCTDSVLEIMKIGVRYTYTRNRASDELVLAFSLD